MLCSTLGAVTPGGMSSTLVEIRPGLTWLPWLTGLILTTLTNLETLLSFSELLVLLSSLLCWNLNFKCVVYFDQQAGAAHYICWSKHFVFAFFRHFSNFSHQNEVNKKNKQWYHCRELQNSMCTWILCGYICLYYLQSSKQSHKTENKNIWLKTKILFEIFER